MTVHCIGNGRVCVYGKGTEIFQAFGPDYSSPEAFRLREEAAPCTLAAAETKTEKISRIAFRHVGPGREIFDYIPPGPAAFTRRINGSARFIVSFENGRISPSPFDDTVIAITRPGAPSYIYEFENSIPHAYTSSRFRYTAFRYEGAVRCVALSDSEMRIETEGEALLLFAFAPTPESLSGQLEDAREAVRSIRNYGDPRLFPETDIGVAGDHPYRKAIADGYDVIAAQQSDAGSVLAGYNYHLSYVRDNYGVFRFLLAAGAYPRARRMLDYYVKVFREYGRIQNAQGMTEYAFHVHENDNVEITGYLVLMFTSYYAATGDNAMLAEGRALIEYCLRAQHGSMTRGMLTFNGDETYIAGGFLPRSALNDGSAEATALYHKAISGILLCASQGAAALSRATEDCIKADLAEIERCFGKRFFGADGTFYCNCPDSGFAPLIRPGGPLQCGHGFGMSYRNGNGDYVCPDCFRRELPPLFPGLYGRRFTTEAAILSPAFAEAGLIPDDKAKSTALKVLSELPSRERFVGYEYGMAMFAAGFDAGTAAKMLSLRDEFGAWSEYYERGALSGTLCRPWETAVNLAALIETFRRAGCGV